MTKKVFLVLKGFFLGVANLIPGVSGGTIAVTLGIYEYILDAINNLFKNFKKSFYKLLPIALGIFLCFISMSKVISYTLEHYQFQTILFFIGLIIGGMPLLFNKIKKTNIKKNIIWFIITFAIIVLFVFLNPNNNQVDFSNMNFLKMLALLGIGIVASATMVIPGISGSFVLMLLGYYEPIINILSDITNFSNIGHNILVLAPFGIGCALGIVLIAKLIKWLIEKYEIKFYYGIIGFVIASIIGVVVEIEPFKATFGSIALGIICFFWGFFVTKALLKENK